ncbi:MAG: NosD domain-containing protein [Promethearchaeota archaeon]
MKRTLSLGVVLICTLVFPVWIGITVDTNSLYENDTNTTPIKSNNPLVNVNGDAALGLEADSGNGNTVPYVIENRIINANGSIAILIQNTESNLIIRDSILYNCSTGINLVNVSNARIRNVTVYNGTFGFKLESNCYNNTIFKNLIYNCSGFFPGGVGILLDSSTFCVIEDNVVYNCNRSGIFLDNSGHNSVLLNVIWGVEDGEAIIARNSDQSLISGNHVADCLYGIGLYYNDALNVINNFVEDCQNYGIGLSDSNNNDVSYNTLTRTFIRFINVSLGSTLNIISQNTIQDTNDGILIYDCDSNSILNNSFKNVSNYGIYTEHSNFTIIESNTIAGALNGFHMNRGNYNTIVSNSFNGCDDGMYLLYSNHTTITRNIFSSSTGYGLNLVGTYSNIIYLNTFINNTGDNAIDDNAYDSMNDWDNGSLGNYWDDYTARYPSASNNGIVWNESYVLNLTTSTSQDNFPLVREIGVQVFANFSANATAVNAGDAVAFTFTGALGVPATTFLWDFGDGTTSSGENPVHVFRSGGIHQVTLTVTDSTGATDSMTMAISVTGKNNIPGYDHILVMVTIVTTACIIILMKRKKPGYD